MELLGKARYESEGSHELKSGLSGIGQVDVSIGESMKLIRERWFTSRVDEASIYTKKLNEFD